MILKDFDQETIFLMPDKLKMLSPLELAEYEIENWKLVYYNKGKIKNKANKNQSYILTLF